VEVDPHLLLSALADPTRLRIAMLLRRHGELCVCTLVCALDTHQPKVSRHLAVLRRSGLIQGRRQGQWIHYRLDPNLPGWARRVVEEIAKGCERTADFADDERRLAASDPATACRTS